MGGRKNQRNIGVTPREQTKSATTTPATTPKQGAGQSSGNKVVAGSSTAPRLYPNTQLMVQEQVIKKTPIPSTSRGGHSLFFTPSHEVQEKSEVVKTEGTNFLSAQFPSPSITEEQSVHQGGKEIDTTQLSLDTDLLGGNENIRDVLLLHKERIKNANPEPLPASVFDQVPYSSNPRIQHQPEEEQPDYADNEHVNHLSIWTTIQKLIHNLSAEENALVIETMDIIGTYPSGQPFNYDLMMAASAFYVTNSALQRARAEADEYEIMVKKLKIENTGLRDQIHIYEQMKIITDRQNSRRDPPIMREEDLEKEEMGIPITSSYSIEDGHSSDKNVRRDQLNLDELDDESDEEHIEDHNQSQLQLIIPPIIKREKPAIFNDVGKYIPIKDRKHHSSLSAAVASLRALSILNTVAGDYNIDQSKFYEIDIKTGNKMLYQFGEDK
ncbi:MAG: hypothetical protein FTSRV1_gp2 [Hangzhou tipula scripta rhabdovirus 1]|nr:MAG: hypothetical protein FTSRV1_gp2 [Hangzhou tipula scripta rhabdovirus 1]